MLSYLERMADHLEPKMAFKIKKITTVFYRTYNLILIKYQNIGIYKENSISLVNNPYQFNQFETSH